ncbi:MMPL family transporter [Entomobacter blattae]|uniref:MMPL family protein n=1 Tax=Entomobacter blattae TaxID=2762277 RepID=A0A7H1NP34_9PROT|nr:MMPL family transporter [Entomobacter blattae]QNT77544.1 MMPL family protein [Entomobacter blattae]
MLAHCMEKIVLLCSRYAWLVLVLTLFLAGGAIWATKFWLGVTTDTSIMFSSSLPWRERSNQLAKNFPQKENLLVAIVQGDIPEITDLTAQELAEKLTQDHQNFKSVLLPGDDPYLEKNGLLFLEPKALDALMDTTIQAQPFLGSMAADPSARGLFQAISLIAQGVKENQADLSSFKEPLKRFAKVINDDADGKHEYLSWENLLAGELIELKGRYQFIVIQPVLDFSSLVPGEKATSQMKKIIAELPFVKSGQAKIHITGQVQINDEEFSTVAQGMVSGLLVSFGLVSLWLFLAVKTWRVILPILFSLVMGLLFTTGFAAIWEGTLNLISVAFAILYIGIAVDFAIQFSVRFRAQKVSYSGRQGLHVALGKTAKETGPQIFIASLATSAGFMAFIPTSFVGVAQLGVIAGVGMLIAFFCTLTLLPAALSVFKPPVETPETGFLFMMPVDKAIRTHRKYILAVFAGVACLGIVLTPHMLFDSDPLHTKNPNSEGMQALSLLVQDPHTSPYNAEMMVNSVEEGYALQKSLSALPTVGDVIWLYSFVPEKQNEKLPILASARDILFPTLVVGTPKPISTAEDIRQAAAKTAADLAGIMDKLNGDDPLRSIYKALVKLTKEPDEDVLAVNNGLTRFLPLQLDRLRLMLSVNKEVTVKDIPEIIRRDYVAPDGRLRFEIHPKGNMQDNSELRKFVKEVYTVTPQVSGSAIDVFESAETIISSFKVAAASALVVITFILIVGLRDIKIITLVLAPLILSGLMTVIMIVVLPEILNFANIIALPLLLGVGVSFNIYFAMNWGRAIKNPLSSPTARAVLFSALTTGSAFGSLAASHHPGTASMGRMLLLSLACTLVASLIFLPAFMPNRPNIDE